MATSQAAAQSELSDFAQYAAAQRDLIRSSATFLCGVGFRDESKALVSKRIPYVIEAEDGADTRALGGCGTIDLRISRHEHGRSARRKAKP